MIDLEGLRGLRRGLLGDASPAHSDTGRRSSNSDRVCGCGDGIRTASQKADNWTGYTGHSQCRSAVVAASGGGGWRGGDDGDIESSPLHLTIHIVSLLRDCS